MRKIIALAAIITLLAGFGAAETDFTGNTVITPMSEVTIGGEGDSIDMNWYEIRGGGVILHITSGEADGDLPETAAENGKVKWFDEDKGYGFIVIETGGTEEIIVSPGDGEEIKGRSIPENSREFAHENGRKTVKPVAVEWETDRPSTIIIDGGNLPGFPANWDLKIIPGGGEDTSSWDIER